MKAVILNSGVGKRMGDLTLAKPKCLVRISESDTILSHEIKMLLECGIDEFVITTGPFRGMIENYLARVFPDLDVEYVNNPEYEKTNYIYSMHLARELIVDDIILLHGDLVADAAVCGMLMDSKSDNAVVVNAHVPLPEKDFKAKLRDGKVEKVGVYLEGEDCVFLLPMYKLSKTAMRVWMDEIGEFIARGNMSVYAEEAFNAVSGSIPLSPAYMERDSLCMEIDTPEDLELAKGLAGNRIA